MILTPKQIGLVIYEVGIWGPGGDEKSVTKFLDTAIAICLAESGGNTRAKNATSSATGLWQIMVSVHGDIIKQESERWWGEDGWPGANTSAPAGYRKPDIYDPRVNTSCAARIWYNAGKSWQPWEVYNTGAYKKHLGHGKAVYAYLNRPEQVQKDLAALIEEIKLGRETFETAAQILNPAGAQITSPDGILNKALEFLRQSGIVVGVFLVALILVILGMWLILGTPNPVKALPVSKLLRK